MKYRSYPQEFLLDSEVASFFAERLKFRLGEARKGDAKSESKLINRLCDVRASIAHFPTLPRDLREVIEEVVAYLRSVGRTITFGSNDPTLWVSARDGRPRNQIIEIEEVEAPLTIGMAFRTITRHVINRARNEDPDRNPLNRF